MLEWTDPFDFSCTPFSHCPLPWWHGSPSPTYDHLRFGHFDFIACPHIPILPSSELVDIDEFTPGLTSLTFDPDGLFRVIREWKSVARLEIYGIDDGQTTSLPMIYKVIEPAFFSSSLLWDWGTYIIVILVSYQNRPEWEGIWIEPNCHIPFLHMTQQRNPSCHNSPTSSSGNQ